MTTAKDFSIGDKVLRGGTDRGEVEKIMPDGSVRVRFDLADKDGKHWYGEYDEFWFRIHPELLMHI